MKECMILIKKNWKNRVIFGVFDSKILYKNITCRWFPVTQIDISIIKKFITIVHLSYK